MKTPIIALVQKLKLTNAILIPATFLLFDPASADAKTTAFSGIFVFGDSLSDIGNLQRLSGGAKPPPGYAGGRFSNGPLWVEYLAADLGMPVVPSDNYAVAGATTARLNSNEAELGLDLPGLQDEIDAFLAGLPDGKADPDALYIVWAGAIDFFFALETGEPPEVLIGTGVANTVQAIQRLRTAGAEHILVPNVPDLGVIPYVRALGISELVSHLAAAYNITLAEALNLLAESGSPTIQVDAFAVLDAMVDSPNEFGFTNVTIPLLMAAPGAAPDEFVFWDQIHPTTRAHQVLEDEALARLIDFFSPSRGHGYPPARVNALKGLANACHQH